MTRENVNRQIGKYLQLDFSENPKFDNVLLFLHFPYMSVQIKWHSLLYPSPAKSIYTEQSRGLTSNAMGC
jgi:hypothetical protein